MEGATNYRHDIISFTVTAAGSNGSSLGHTCPLATGIKPSMELETDILYILGLININEKINHLNKIHETQI